jgi:hypothetical protein
MTGYRLRYLDRSHKFIRADRVDAATDDEAIKLAALRRLQSRSELWKGAKLVAKFPRGRLPKANTRACAAS